MESYNSQPESPMQLHTQSAPPMKWHKFLIYFSLWAGALLTISDGCTLLNGLHYGGNAEQVYRYFSSLRSVDCTFAVIYFGIAAFMIYTRFQLAGFKQGAPGKLTLLYILQLIITLAYGLIVSNIVGMSFSEAMGETAITSLGSSIAMIFINRSYYGKRDYLFVN